jgi:hypothetical protein
MHCGKPLARPRRIIWFQTSYHVHMVTSTVQPTRSRRRVVRKTRPTIDQAWSTALADLPSVLHEPVRRYIETSRTAYATRQDLTSALAGTDVRWRDVDRLMWAFSAA